MNKVMLVISLIFFSGCASAHPVKHGKPIAAHSHHPETIRVWVDGHWAKHGHQLYWQKGHWVTKPAPKRPGPRSRWIPGHYNRHGSWVPGHWR